MKKVYRVQDLASSGRKVTIDAIDVQFDGHYASGVPESIIYWFDRMDEFQVYQPTEVPDVVVPTPKVESTPPVTAESTSSLKKEEPTINPYTEAQKGETKGEPTVSPNLAEVTEPEITKEVERPSTTQSEVIKPRDDTPKVEPITVTPVETVKPRTA